MTERGLHKLAEAGMTTPELVKLCVSILESYAVPLLAVELASILSSDCGKLATSNRIANVLADNCGVRKGRWGDLPAEYRKLCPRDGDLSKYTWYWI